MSKGEAAGAAWEVIAEMASQCVMMRSRLIARVITGLYDQELRSHGINSAQMALLLVMHALGPSSRAEIGRYHHQDRSTLTRNLQVLLAEGWVEEHEADGKGRARPMRLTEAGVSLVLRAEPAWRAGQSKARLLLGEAGVSTVMEIGQRILRSGA